MNTSARSRAAEDVIEMPRVRVFSDQSVAITCCVQAMHLRPQQAFALAQVLAGLLLEDEK